MREKQRSSKLSPRVVLCCQYDSDYYDFDELKAIIGSAVEKANKLEERFDMEFFCLDEGKQGGHIPAEIKETISHAAIVIFELSDHNPNVLVELGLAWRDRHFILLVEEEAKNKTLPFNIASFRINHYRRDSLSRLEVLLKKQISETLSSMSISDFIPDKDVNYLLSQYITVPRKTSEFSECVAEMMERCSRNFYYLGSAGLAPIQDEWINAYRTHLSEVQSCHRIVNLKSLGEVYEQSKNLEAVIDHCIWLVKYYKLIEDKVMQLYHSQAVAENRSGLSMMVFDEEEVIIAMGRLGERNFNHKGIVLYHDEAAAIAFDYAKTLAVVSEPINKYNIGRFFSLKEPTKTVPEDLVAVADGPLEKLRSVCEDYIFKQLDEQ